MGVAEWLTEHWGGTGWAFVLLAAVGVVAGVVLAWPRKPQEERDRYRGTRRPGERTEGRHRAPEGGQSTWEYIDSGAWKTVGTGRAQVDHPLEETVVLRPRETPADTTEEGDGHGQGRRTMGPGAPGGPGAHTRAA